MLKKLLETCKGRSSYIKKQNYVSAIDDRI